MILDLFREAICRASKATHRHAHGEFLRLYVVLAHVSRIGIAVDHLELAADAFSRAIPFLTFGCFVVELRSWA